MTYKLQLKFKIGRKTLLITSTTSNLSFNRNPFVKISRITEFRKLLEHEVSNISNCSALPRKIVIPFH